MSIFAYQRRQNYQVLAPLVVMALSLCESTPSE